MGELESPTPLPLTNDSVIGRLLCEVSWEGTAGLRRYRDGGRGLENVLTAEVLSALNFLPRTAFLGQILHEAHGADAGRQTVIDEIEDSALAILDEIVLNPHATSRGEELIVQPDALIVGENSYALLELKGLRANEFGYRQLAKEYVAVMREARERTPLVLLIMRHEPPIKVEKAGRLSIDDAVALQLEQVLAGAADHSFEIADLMQQIPEVFAWITWDEVAEIVQRQGHAFATADQSVSGTVRRLVASVASAIETHT